MSLSHGIIVLAVALGLTACGDKKVSNSAAADEAKRSILRSADQAATDLASLGRHDKQYYLDRFGKVLSDCTKGGDVDMTCFESGVKRVSSE